MSVRALAWAFEQQIDATAKLVLLALADHSSEDGDCWVGMRTLQAKTSLKERAIQTACRRLEAGGLIRKSPRFHAGRQTTNLWEVVFRSAAKPTHPPALDAPTPPHQMHPPPAPDAPPGAHQMHPKNRQEEPSELTEQQNPHSPQGGAAQVVEIWNARVEGTNLPKARATPKRSRVILARLKEPGWLDDFREALASIRSSEWHRGGNDRGWIATIDYLLQAGKATELAEKARTKPVTRRQGPAGPGFRATADQALAAQLQGRTRHAAGAADQAHW